jgi:K(+)-stimulated pyrophosphate-energized sodium pump
MSDFFMSFSAIIVVFVIGLIGLGYAFYLKHRMEKQQVTDPKLVEIQSYIHEGAMAFLRREYKTLGIFVVVLFVVIAIAIGIWTAISFLLGAFLSGLAGFIGMQSATSANARTTQAAKTGGMNAALQVAFAGGTIMVMCGWTWSWRT